MVQSIYVHRDKNIAKTWIIMLLFFGIVIGTGWVFAQIYGNAMFLVMAVLFSTLMSIISYWYSDRIVLAMAKARPVTMREAPELYRIVENLSITAGLPMPKLYIIDESAPNAFATGRNPKHAVVAVSEGLLERLDRSELEGVIAHEISHIGNRDTLVSTVAVILVGFLALLSDFFMRSLWWGGMSRRDSRHEESRGVIMLIGIVLAMLAPLAGTLLRLAVSRKREFLADASGALLTRYPQALANALIKISKDPTPLHVANNTTSHLWFSDPFENKKQTPFFHKLFMTHPPVEERVKALMEMSL
jgi:heat shock protein HtpX